MNTKIPYGHKYIHAISYNYLRKHLPENVSKETWETILDELEGRIENYVESVLPDIIDQELERETEQ
jgi:hypothetical protein